MAMDYPRSYSPVPPPCPSPQLMPQPLPTPPVYTPRPSLTPSTASRERVLAPPNLKLKPSAAASSDSLVFSLKDAIVAGSPSRRRFSEHARLREASLEDYTLHRRQRTADVDRSFVSLPSPVNVHSPAPTTFKRKHRRSDSMTRQSYISSSASRPPSRSLARKRTRSPTGRPSIVLPDVPPPVPPLPPLPAKRDRGRCSSLFSKMLPPIRIPELGLGLEERLRSPLSPFIPCTQTRQSRRGSRSKAPGSEGTSFLNISSSKRHSKRHPGRASMGEREPLSDYIPIRSTHSLPDIKTAQRRSNPSFASRMFRLGTQQRQPLAH